MKLEYKIKGSKSFDVPTMEVCVRENNSKLIKKQKFKIIKSIRMLINLKCFVILINIIL
jgi:hypothetical protein